MPFAVTQPLLHVIALLLKAVLCQSVLLGTGCFATFSACLNKPESLFMSCTAHASSLQMLKLDDLFLYPQGSLW